MTAGQFIHFAKWITCLSAAVTIGAASASAAITIDTVYVGDAGNPNDSTGFGSVSYGYYIGTYEVTNAQYAAFLNAVAATDPLGLYSTAMAGIYGGIERSGTDGSFTYTATKPNNPVNYVSFWDAARFTNWVTSGNTETGVYVLTADGITNNTITRDNTAWADGGVAIASENEWYKAAYYQPMADGGDSDGYWLYPTASNSITTAEANYAVNEDSVGNLTAVGTYGGEPSYYGTFDQGGNLREWNEQIIRHNYPWRRLRGGSFDKTVYGLQSSKWYLSDVADGQHNVGFRVSSLAPIPEPSHYAAIVGILGLGLTLTRRRGRGADSPCGRFRRTFPWSFPSGARR